jgi:hypothetical protein
MSAICVSDLRLRVALLTRAATLETFCSVSALNDVLLQEAESSLVRRSHHDEGAVRLARLLLNTTTPAFDAGQPESLPSFVIDMNKLCERFVARLCVEWAPPGLIVEMGVVA